MFENEIKLIALFFFFATLDDKKATAYASKASDLFYLRMKRNPQMNSYIALVSVTQKVWNKNKKTVLRGGGKYSTEAGWILPEDLDISAWQEFQKTAQEEELLVVIWSLILKIKDEDISLSLGIPEGTLRYRLGRGLRRLGSMIRPQKQKISLV